MKAESKNEKEVKHALDKCINAPHAEMARNYDPDEPCETE